MAERARWLGRGFIASAATACALGASSIGASELVIAPEGEAPFVLASSGSLQAETVSGGVTFFAELVSGAPVDEVVPRRSVMLRMATPASAALEPGLYLDPGCPADSPFHPCSPGVFEILELSYDAGGEVTRLNATFEVLASPLGPVRGVVDYVADPAVANAAVPDATLGPRADPSIRPGAIDIALLTSEAQLGGPARKPGEIEESDDDARLGGPTAAPEESTGAADRRESAPEPVLQSIGPDATTGAPPRSFMFTFATELAQAKRSTRASKAPATPDGAPGGASGARAPRGEAGDRTADAPIQFFEIEPDDAFALPEHAVFGAGGAAPDPTSMMRSPERASPARRDEAHAVPEPASASAPRDASLGTGGTPPSSSLLVWFRGAWRDLWGWIRATWR